MKNKNDYCGVFHKATVPKVVLTFKSCKRKSILCAIEKLKETVIFHFKNCKVILFYLLFRFSAILVKPIDHKFSLNTLLATDLLVVMSQ